MNKPERLTVLRSLALLRQVERRKSNSEWLLDQVATALDGHIRSMVTKTRKRRAKR